LGTVVERTYGIAWQRPGSPGRCVAARTLFASAHPQPPHRGPEGRGAWRQRGLFSDEIHWWPGGLVPQGPPSPAGPYCSQCSPL